MLCTPWVTENELVGCDCTDVPAHIVTQSLLAASEVLYRLTGQQYPGVCEETVRPCGTQGSGLVMGDWRWQTQLPFRPVRLNGQTWNIGACSGCHWRQCGCGGYPAVNLGRQDVQSVTEVQVNTETLDPSAYRLDSAQWLVRLDGDAWPCCQDMTAEPGTDGAFVIDIEYGAPVPQALKNAAASYAAELILACTGDKACRLPSRITSIVRQGISVDTLVITEGGTGLHDVDTVVNAFNPNGHIIPPSVWSPETVAPAIRS